jgi:hypothetical protein
METLINFQKFSYSNTAYKHKCITVAGNFCACFEGGWLRGQGDGKSSLTVTEGEIYGDGGGKERGVYREVMILLATLSLLTRTAMRATLVAGKGTSRSGNCSFI